MAHVRLFISAVSKEFLSYREALRKALQRHNVTALIQEDFIAGGLPTLDKLDLYIRDCDGVIHLAGDMTGAMAKPASLKVIRKLCPHLAERIPEIKPAFDGGGLELSYTQWEAYLAIYHGKELLIAVPAEAAQREKDTFVKDPIQQAAQQTHLARLTRHERHPGITFLDDRDLALGIYRSTLYDLLVKAGIESATALLPPPDDVAERRHREILEAVARDKGVDPKDLIPILENLGHQEPNISPSDIPRRLSERVDALRAAAAKPVAASNEGEDIDIVRRASSEALKDAKTDQAIAILDKQLAREREVMEDRKRRMVTLLQDRAEVERLRYDYAATRSTLQEVLRLDLDQVWSWIDLGRDWRTVGSLKDADGAFQSALAAARRTGAERSETVALTFLGDVLVDRGNLPEALKAYDNGLTMAVRLANADPSNANWQCDLGITNERIGNVLMAQGDLAGALNSYRAKRDIISRLAKAEPDNALWQRDLSVSYDRLGNVLVAQGNLPEALKSYRDGLAIRDRLAKADPGNAGWQRDLSVSYAKLTVVFRKTGNNVDALNALRQGQAIMSRMTRLSPDNAEWKQDLAWFNEQITGMGAKD